MLTYYKIKWYYLHSTAQSYTVGRLSTSYTVDGLQPCVLYTFSVTAFTKAGEGASAFVDGTTKLEGTV